MNETDGPDAAASVPSWAGWAVVAALFLVIGGCTLLFRGDSGGLEGQHADATRVCEGFVKDRILNPAGAEFSAETATGTAASGVTVTGTVDAAVRQRFTCTVVLEGDQWRLDGLAIS